MNIFLNDVRQILGTAVQFWRGVRPLNPLGLRQALLAMPLMAVARVVVDRFLWVPEQYDYRLSVLEFFLWTIYAASLYLFTAFLLSRFNTGIDFSWGLTLSVCLFWLIPLVPLFSLLPWENALGLGQYATIPFFRWIPTFMVENNYLPLGMIFVSPVLIWKTYRIILQTERTSNLWAFLKAALVFLVIYILYYQWIWAISTIALYKDIFMSNYARITAQFIAYSVPCQAITVLLTPTLVRSFGQHRVALYTSVSSVILAFLLLIPRVGFLAVFMNTGHP